MDAKFTIPYGEFAVIEALKKEMKGFSVFLPSSRQEKGIDLLLMKSDETKNTHITIQVKQSRTYYDQKIITVDGETIPVVGHLWFNRFAVPQNADWFILVGIHYVQTKPRKNASVRSFVLDQILLAFTKDEITDFLNNLKQKKNPLKNDNNFAFSYDEDHNIYQTRGVHNCKNMNRFLLKNRIPELKAFFES